MQSKIIAAAAIASSATALQLETPTTKLDQQSQYQVCHGTYAYQCIEEKVEKALDHMTLDVQTHKDECIVSANDVRQEIVKEVMEIREYLTEAQSNLRMEQMKLLNEKLEASTASIQNAVIEANKAICDEAEQRVEGTSPASQKRKAVENEIKKLYYENSDGYQPYELKEKIAEKVKDYDDYVNENQRDFMAIAEIEAQKVEEVISFETQCLADDIAGALQVWNEEAEYITQTLNERISEKVNQIDQIIADKIVYMDVMIENLTEDFIVVFWDTIEEIYEFVNYSERQGLVWKALYQKDQFISEIAEIRDTLVTGLAEVRATLVEELNIERANLVTYLADERNSFTEETNNLKSALSSVASQARQDVENTINKKQQYLEDNNYQGETVKLEAFVYDLAAVQYNPSGAGNGGSGLGHGAGFQPYAKWVSNDLQDQIGVFGDKAISTFDSVTKGEIEMLKNTLLDEKNMLSVDNSNMMANLTSMVNTFIETLLNTRENIEMGLTEQQTAQEAQDEEQRDIDQIALITKKNNLWKDMSWIIRRTHIGGGHEHGLSAGPLYGYVIRYAQVSDHSHHEPHGYEEEHQGDGYDAYGYGEHGYGYGYAQKAYKEIQQKIKAMEDAQIAIVEQNEARIANSEAALRTAQEEAWIDFENSLEEKWYKMQEAIQQATYAWNAAVDGRTQTMQNALEKARHNILAAKQAKVDALDAEEKEIRWGITSIYNYEVQHALTEAMDAARAAADEICNEKARELVAEVEYVENKWNECVSVETELWRANAERELERCRATKAEQVAVLTAFKDAQRQRFEEWAQSERVALAEFVAECEEAWHWILTSYCLKHGEAGDIESAGYGCSYGQGAGFGNGGFRKGVAIEEHGAVLAYGQDLEIKHIQGVGALIQHAVDFTMEGVAEAATEQVALVNAAQQQIHYAVEDGRYALMNSLNGKLTATIFELAGIVDEHAQSLKDREDAAVAALDTDRQAYDQAVVEVREATLWDLKELVWRLGYTQGYHYGAHDGHDYELLQQITAKKDEFEAAVVETLQKMHERIEAEREAGDAAIDEARTWFDQEAARLTSEMEDRIAAALATFEAALQEAKDAMQAECERATAALNAFIAERLAVWEEKYTYEEINAKWQEDSYYRYNLLRLLKAKDEAIRAAVAQTQSHFADAMAAEKAESTQFRGEERDAMAQFVAEVRDELTRIVNEADERLEESIAEREASLGAALDTQYGLLQAAMQECRAEMQRRLKEIYSYNSYDIDAGKEEAAAAYSPYSHEQHKAFLHKFAYYLKDVKAAYDAQVANLRTAWAAKVATLTEESSDQTETLKRQLFDAREETSKSLSRFAEDVVEAYQEDQDLDLVLLRESRAAAEAAAYSEAEGFRKQIIYSMHVIRYAGGKDHGSFGFGNYGSSYHGKGNSLTGIDELDLYRVPNKHGYAQVSARDGVTDDEHHAKLVQMLADSKTGFDDMIEACKADFAALVAEEKLESMTRKEKVNQDLWERAAEALEARTQQGEALKAELSAANNARKEYCAEVTQTALDAFHEEVMAQMAKIDGWFQEKLDWINKLYDSDYKAHLVTELEKKGRAALDSLQARKDEAQIAMDEARQTLAENLQADEDMLWDFHEEQIAILTAKIEDLKRQTEAEAEGVDSAFCDAALDEQAAKDEAAARLVKNWAYWLKYIYGYDGYPEEIYADYDDTHDYSEGYTENGFKDPHTESDLDGDNIYTNAVASGGHGYGGPGANDYIDSTDHLGLAYGSQTAGPQPTFDLSNFFGFGNDDAEAGAHGVAGGNNGMADGSTPNASFIQAMLGMQMLQYQYATSTYTGLSYSA